MWKVLKGNREKCRKLRDALEEAATKCTDAPSVKGLIEELPGEERNHIEVCADCQQAARELVATRELFHRAVRLGEEERPWFAGRVMAAIASRERELAQRVSAWTEFPRFASRVAWVMAVVLLAGTTWFYERVVRISRYEPQESLFEAPQQTTQDDILISMAGNNP